MRSLIITFAISAAVVLAASFAPSVQAAAVGTLGTLAPPAASSPIEPAACRGRPGPHCPPGRHWVCGRYGYRCWCAPC